jgi:ketosteroid isomerase-like protein
MRRAFELFLVLLILIAPMRVPLIAADDSQSADEQAKKEVLEVENQLNQALLHAAADALRRIYTDDLAYMNAGGEVMSKDQVISEFQSGEIKLLTLGRDDIRLHVFGGAVVLNGISTAALEYKGHVSYGPRRFTNIYVKVDGKWRLASHNVSLITKK